MSNVKLTCDMVNDMLPLYVDGMLSEESKTAVAAHLGNCSKCQQTVADINAELGDLTELAEQDSGLFKRVQKGFRKKYFTRAAIIISVFLILWVGANFYLMSHYSPIYPKALPDYIEECLDVVSIDGEFYLHQKDLFGQGEIVLLNCENGEINFYLGENGIRNLGLGRSWMITPKYQQLFDSTVMEEEVTTVNYCKPDGTVITTLWQKGEELKELQMK